MFVTALRARAQAGKSHVVELQELAKQHRLEQVQIATLLERFPNYVMVLSAEVLTIQAINPAYKEMAGSRDVNGCRSERFLVVHRSVTQWYPSMTSAAKALFVYSSTAKRRIDRLTGLEGGVKCRSAAMML